MKVLSRYNVCSKESVIRQYDHEVQAGTVVKPLVGAFNDGPGDATVFRPLLETWEGLVISSGICPRYSDLDTYHMMACAIDEAIRNNVAVGGNLKHMAGLDNFCWCDPVQSEKTPDGEYKLAQLVRANMALYDYTTAFGVPCISGKDSMKNDYLIGSTKISIPPTVLFSAVSVVTDVRKCVTMDAKRPGDLVYVLGETFPETGSFGIFRPPGFIGNRGPQGRCQAGQGPLRSPGARRFGRAGLPPATTVPTGGWAWPWPRPPLPAPWAWRWICGGSPPRKSSGTIFSCSPNRRAGSL